MNEVNIVDKHSDFLHHLIDEILADAEQSSDIFYIAKTRVYLPNSLCCKWFKREFINKLENDSFIPRIISLQDVLNPPYDKVLWQMVSGSEGELLHRYKSSIRILKSSVAAVLEGGALDNHHLAVRYLEDITYELDIHINYIRDIDFPVYLCAIGDVDAHMLRLMQAVRESKRGRVLISNSGSQFFAPSMYESIATKSDQSCAEISMIEAHDSLEEAEVVALFVRYQLEKGKFVHIVTDDSALFQDVRILLKKWNVFVSSTMKESFKNTKIATLSLLIARVLQDDFSEDSLNNILRALCLKNEQYSAVWEWKNRWMDETKNVNQWSELSELHILMVEEFISTVGFESIHYIDDLKAIHRDLNIAERVIISHREYLDFLIYLYSTKGVKQLYDATMGITAVSLEENNILASKVVVLCGMNQSNLTATDDVQVMSNRRKTHNMISTVDSLISSAKEVLISRSKNKQGGKQERSRILDLLLSEKEVNEALNRGRTWTNMLMNMKHDIYKSEVRRIAPAVRPAPLAPVNQAVFSVSDTEKLLNNPYYFYVSKILKLRSSSVQKHGERGSILHSAIHQLTQYYVRSGQNPEARDLENKVLAILQENNIGKYHFGDWIFKLRHISKFWADNANINSNVSTEIKGGIDLPIDDNVSIRLNCVADRVDFKGNIIDIWDYKSGDPPGYKAVISLSKPQILLEALIASRGGFLNKRYSPDRLMFMRLGGSLSSLKVITAMGAVSDALLVETESKVAARFKSFLLNNEPFAAEPPEFYGEYDHLSRSKEWNVL